MLEQQRQSQCAALGDAGEAVDIVKAKGQHPAAQDGQQDICVSEMNHSFPKRLPDLWEKVKKWQKKEVDMDKIAKLGHRIPNETIENGCRIWYNYCVILWKHNRKEL